MCRIVKTCRIGDIIAKLDRGFTKDGTGDADRTHVIDATMLLNGEAWRKRIYDGQWGVLGMPSTNI